MQEWREQNSMVVWHKVKNIAKYIDHLWYSTGFWVGFDSVKNFVTHFLTLEIWTLNLLARERKKSLWWRKSPVVSKLFFIVFRRPRQQQEAIEKALHSIFGEVMQPLSYSYEIRRPIKSRNFKTQSLWNSMRREKRPLAAKKHTTVWSCTCL